MWAALFSGIGWKGWLGIAMAGALVWATIAVRSADRAAGAAGATGKINAANNAARDKADAVTRQILDCPPGKWVRGEGCKQ